MRRIEATRKNVVGEAWASGSGALFRWWKDSGGNCIGEEDQGVYGQCVLNEWPSLVCGERLIRVYDRHNHTKYVVSVGCRLELHVVMPFVILDIENIVSYQVISCFLTCILSLVS